MHDRQASQCSSNVADSNVSIVDDDVGMHSSNECQGAGKICGAVAAISKCAEPKLEDSARRSVRFQHHHPQRI